MSDKIIELSKHQKPVTYRLTITHHFDGTIETFVHDIADDERSRAAVGYALRRIAEGFLNEQADAAALRQARLDALEEAAKACDKLASDPRMYSAERRRGCGQCSAAILALMEKSDG